MTPEQAKAIKLSNAIKQHRANPLTDGSQTDNIKKNAQSYIQDGVFEHHKSFYFIDGGYFFYREYFGNGWHKRKPNKDGWIKYQTSLAYNVNTHQLTARSSVM